MHVTDVFEKPGRVKRLKDKNDKTVLNGFIGIGNRPKSKPNKLWVDQGRELNNKPLQNGWMIMIS